MPGPVPGGWAQAARQTARAAREDATFAWQARVLPRRVARLQLRARLAARRGGDRFSLVSATRPGDLAYLLALAQGRRNVVELGTGTAWTTSALAVAEPERIVTSYDPIVRPERERYLALLAPADRSRIELVAAPGADGPRPAGGPSSAPAPVDLLYVDSSHERADVIAELRAWTPVLAPGALVVLDDYAHAHFRGVAEAVAELGLSGSAHGTLFVHVHAAGPPAAGAPDDAARLRDEIRSPR